MSDFKRGDILALKTTGEVVFVIKAFPESKDETEGGILLAPDPDAGKVFVRRPLLTEFGIKHEITPFFPEELETVEEYIDREATVQGLKLEAQRKLMDKKVQMMKSARSEDIDFTVN